MEVEVDTETRPFFAACDWCATTMTREVRRDQAGRMIVVQVMHKDPKGKPCRGSGRGIPTWPLHVELRDVAGVYELRIGNGLALEYSSPRMLDAKLRELGVNRDELLQQVAAVGPGQPYSFEVSERRRQPRGRTG